MKQKFREVTPFAVALALYMPEIGFAGQITDVSFQPTSPLAVRCGLMSTSQSFEDTSIQSAKVETHTGESGPLEYCEIIGIVSPEKGSHIGVVYRLPSNWNGKLLGLGGGGFAGNVTLQESLPGLAQGYATLQTDGGHSSSSPWDTSWALNEDGSVNAQGLVDFSFRAVHLMTTVGRQVVERYYGHAPLRAYFQGCSQGGHQALTEAQRYPKDFIGIIAGAPAAFEASWVRDTMAGRAFSATEAKLSNAQIQLVNDAVLESCDRLDGVKDGIVANPMACRWDPQPLLCGQGSSKDTCLTAPQVDAVRAAYADHQSPEGIRAYGLPRGSELLSFTFYSGLTRDFQVETGYPNFSLAAGMKAGIDFTRNDVVAETEDRYRSLFGAVFVSRDPDLSPFVMNGAKLLLWHGLYDPLIAAQATVDYYENVKRVTGVQLSQYARAKKLEDSVVLFTLPGVGHCGGGPGPSQFNALAALNDWAEGGVAPQRLIAQTEPVKDAASESRVMTRPLCAWPKMLHYNRGDPMADKSFSCELR